MKIWVGTSGWSYKGWAEVFYPPKCPASKLLSYYVTQFPTVETNATFYRLPTARMLQGWCGKVPEEFIFSVKGSRFITHIKKLEAGEGVDRFFERLEPLTSHMGPVLWQLPPFLHKGSERLENFLKGLPRQFHHAIEFRHPSWICEEIFELLRQYNAACVWVSSQIMPRNFTITADFIYARLHGLEDGAAHDYTEKELEPWAEHLSKAAARGVSAYVYFNNDVNVRAPRNAKTLMELVKPYAVQPFVGELVER